MENISKNLEFLKGQIIKLFAFSVNQRGNYVDTDGVIRNAKAPEDYITPVEGSFYKTFMDRASRILAKSANRDWVAIKDGITKEVLMASQVEDTIKRLSVVFNNLGLKKGDAVHVVCYNHILYHPMTLAVWRLGGYVSLADPALNSTIIRKHVSWPLVLIRASVSFRAHLSSLRT